MKETKYRLELRKVLDENTQEAVNKLNTIIPLLPLKTKSVQIMIFPEQDGEGTFGVRVLLDGPDLFVLNKTIKDFADLINVRHTPKGLTPPVPLLDPFKSKFEVNDVLSDVVGDWVYTLWDQVDSEILEVPITLVAEAGWGSIFPKSLNTETTNSKKKIVIPSLTTVKLSFWDRLRGFFTTK